MPTIAARAIVVGAAAVTLATAASPFAAGAAQDPAADRATSMAWSPFFDSQRAVDTVDARRVVITFEDASLGDWVAARGQRGATAVQRRQWLKKAGELQKRRLDALSLAGVQFTVEHRYLRVVNGASIVVHGDSAQLLRPMSGIASVTPIRTIWPAAVDAEGAAGAAAVIGSSADSTAAQTARPRGAVTVAVLDSGIDARHPAVAGHVLRPYDATRAPSSARAVAGTTISADPHGTAVAGAVLAGAGDGGGGVKVRILPVQVLEQQPARDGVEALFGDSDDVLAGLEHAVDPNRDGSSADAADVAVVASTTPFAGFAGSPEDRAVRAADALGTVVVAAAGNDGASGDAVGTIGSLAASSSALAVGAADLRGTVRAADVRVRGGGVDEVFDAASVLTSDAPLLEGKHGIVVVEQSGDEVVEYLDDQLRSRVTGTVALLMARDGVLVSKQVRAAADAGARAVIVGLDDPRSMSGTIDAAGVDIAAVAIKRSDAQALRDVLVDGERLEVSFERVDVRNPAFGSVAGFSSGGPRLDGVGRPDLLGPGVGMIVAGGDGAWRRVSGTSIAAAWAAGQAAVVRAAYPDATAADVRALLLGSSIALGKDRDRPSVALQGAGVVSSDRAIDGSGWMVPGGRIDFGSVAPGNTVRRSLDLRSLAGTDAPVDPTILLDDGGSDADLVPSMDDGRLVLAVPSDAHDGHVGGWLVLPDLGLRIPWTATVRDGRAITVPMRASVSNQVLRTAAGPGAFASMLQLSIGGSAAGGSLGLTAVERLEVRLVNAKGKVHGVVGGLDQVLPGIYSFGINGVDAAGKPLAPGRWTLAVRYVPASDPDGSWRDGPTASIRVPKR